MPPMAKMPQPAGSSCASPTTAWASRPKSWTKSSSCTSRPGNRPTAATGHGLGLAVVRDLTELHGGTVTVESRVKEGSTFTVRIPYVPVIEEEDEEA